MKNSIRVLFLLVISFLIKVTYSQCPGYTSITVTHYAPDNGGGQVGSSSPVSATYYVSIGSDLCIAASNNAQMKESPSCMFSAPGWYSADGGFVFYYYVIICL